VWGVKGNEPLLVKCPVTLAGLDQKTTATTSSTSLYRPLRALPGGLISVASRSPLTQDLIIAAPLRISGSWTREGFLPFVLARRHLSQGSEVVAKRVRPFTPLRFCRL